jgi:hypothetical protein
MQTVVHYPVTAELMADEQCPMIVLSQQEGIDDTCTVRLHPFQLKSILADFGVIAADQNAEKTITTLERRLLVLRDRIAVLNDYLSNNSDITLVAAHAMATLDVATEFCHGLVALEDGLPHNEVHTKKATKCNPADKQNAMDF